MKYFMLDTGDKNLGFNKDNITNTDNLKKILQISLSITSGTAQLLINENGKMFPIIGDNESYTTSTLNSKQGDIESFGVIHID